MDNFNRRRFLEGTAGVAAAPRSAPARSGHRPCTPRPRRPTSPRRAPSCACCAGAASCRATSTQYMNNVAAFTAKTGVEVRVDNEGWEDVRPKAAVAANTGAGPDIILSTNDDANLYPEKLLDVTDLCQLPRQEVRRLVPGLRGLPAARRQEVDRRGAGRRRRDAGLPPEPREGGRLRHLPEGHRPASSQLLKAPEGQGHAGRLRAGQCHRRRPVDATG